MLKKSLADTYPIMVHRLKRGNPSLAVHDNSLGLGGADINPHIISFLHNLTYTDVQNIYLPECPAQSAQPDRTAPLDP